MVKKNDNIFYKDKKKFILNIIIGLSLLQMELILYKTAINLDR